MKHSTYLFEKYSVYVVQRDEGLRVIEDCQVHDDIHAATYTSGWQGIADLPVPIVELFPSSVQVQ
jgi:hypothetical protein